MVRVAPHFVTAGGAAGAVTLFPVRVECFPLYLPAGQAGDHVPSTDPGRVGLFPVSHDLLHFVQRVGYGLLCQVLQVWAHGWLLVARSISCDTK